MELQSMLISKPAKSDGRGAIWRIEVADDGVAARLAEYARFDEAAKRAEADGRLKPLVKWAATLATHAKTGQSG